jgi:hypothetical protein
MSRGPLDANADTHGRKRRILFGFGALLVLAGLFAAVFGNSMSADDALYRAKANGRNQVRLAVAA